MWSTRKYEMKSNPLALALAASALLWFGAAHAAGGLQLSNQVFQEIEIIGADGKPERKSVPAATVVPGRALDAERRAAARRRRQGFFQGPAQVGQEHQLNTPLVSRS